MNKKVLLVFGGIALLIAIVLVFLPTMKERAFVEEFRFSEYPPDWVEELEEETPDNLTIEINVIEATEGQSDFMLTHQRYIEPDGEVVALFYDGSYGGEAFGKVYTDKTGKEKMRIWNSMNPNNGVIEGFALAKKEGDEWVFYLFIDDDWRKQSRGGINIIWGDDIRDKESLHFKKFDFSTEQNGVYIDKVTEDVDWFTEETIVGRLFFGEISLEDVKAGNYEKTFIAIT